MKRISLFCLLAVVAVLLSSCLKGESHYTPLMRFSALVHISPVTPDSAVVDTIHPKWDEKTGFYRVDTIMVGDTIRMMMLLDGVTNNMVSFLANYDTTALRMVMRTEEISKSLNPVSDPNHGQLYFQPGYVGACVPLYYVPIRAGVHEVEFLLRTESKYSPVSFTMVQPVISL